MIGRTSSLALAVALLSAAASPALAQGLSQPPTAPGQPAGVVPPAPPPGGIPPAATDKPTPPPSAGGPPSGGPPSGGRPAGGCDPTFGGKYRGLLRIVPVPQDAGRYGACNDYGAWQGTSYAGHNNLPQGAYWSYSAPNWYVWAARAGNANNYGGCADPSMGGKYTGYMMRLNIPSNVGQYGQCNDYGRWTGTSYKGYNNLPSGAFWVYSAPYWVVWSQKIR